MKGKKPYKCPICNYEFTHKQNLDRHIFAVHDGKNPHKCTICDATFKHIYNVKSHIQAVHDGIKPYGCSFCNYSTNHKPSLEKHRIAMHETNLEKKKSVQLPKKFKCQICSLKFIINIPFFKREIG